MSSFLTVAAIIPLKDRTECALIFVVRTEFAKAANRVGCSACSLGCIHRDQQIGRVSFAHLRGRRMLSPFKITAE
jgi:hypothetical protein